MTTFKSSILLATVGTALGAGLGLALLATNLDQSPSTAADLGSPPFACESVRVIDGDTFDCGSVRIRLLAIDAPEMEGGCRDMFNCPPLDGEESKAKLAFLLGSGSTECRGFGQDRYGRTLATCSNGGQDISCAMIESGAAAYVRKWDNGRAVASSCPAAR